MNGRASAGSGCGGARRSEVYPALLRLRAALRRQTPVIGCCWPGWSGF
ncbi:MAG: hypothetical protein ACLUFL_00805 [Flavonifractor plautii]